MGAKAQRAREGAAKDSGAGSAGSATQPAVEQAQGNQAAQEDLVQGPIGRLFNRILGMPEDATDTAGMAFTRDQLRAYLEQGLQFAEGEWFRGKKLDGAADALMEKLDRDGDGKVGWPEFQAFRDQTLDVIAPGAAEGKVPVEEAAEGRFEAIDRDRRSPGHLDYGELFRSTKDALPEDTEYPGLVAQLGARLVLDAVDVDQRDRPVKERDVSREEWLRAARELAGGQGTAKKQ